MKQPKFVHVWEWPRPRESRAYEPVTGWANRGVVETGNGSDVPGVLQVREHAWRLCTSQVSGAMIISMISRGSVAAEDW